MVNTLEREPFCGSRGYAHKLTLARSPFSSLSRPPKSEGYRSSVPLSSQWNWVFHGSHSLNTTPLKFTPVLETKRKSTLTNKSIHLFLSDYQPSVRNPHVSIHSAQEIGHPGTLLYPLRPSSYVLRHTLPTTRRPRVSDHCRPQTRLTDHRPDMVHNL